MKIMLKKYPNIVQAMKNRAKVYNQEKDYVFEQEKLGKAFVICPENDLQISRTEKIQKNYSVFTIWGAK